MLAYCEWIKKLAEKITKPHVLDPAYDVNDSYMLITHDHVVITEFTTKLWLGQCTSGILSTTFYTIGTS